MTLLMSAVARAPAVAPRISRRIGLSEPTSARPPEVAAAPEQEHHQHDDQDQCEHSLNLRGSDFNYRIL
jgi:hypothetical protein